MTPDELDILSKGTELQANSFEIYIISRIVKRIMAGLKAMGEVELIPATLKDIYKLTSRGMVAAEIQSAIIQALPILENEIRTAFLNAADQIAFDYDKAAKMPTTPIIEDEIGDKLPEPPKDDKKPEPEKPKQPAKQPQGGGVNIPSSNTPTPEPKAPNGANKAYSYPDFVDECGWGKMLGICGVNCRHTFSPYDPEWGEPKRNIDEEKNKEYYKLTQKQRAMEREIRELERRLAMLKANEDRTEEEEQEFKEFKDLKKLRRQKGVEYSNFVRDNNLPQQNWRFSVATGIKSDGPGNFGKSNLHPSDLEVLDDMFRRTMADVRNLCGTTAAQSEQAFINACNDAFLKRRGGVSLDTVIREAIDQLSRQGITSVHYASGRTDKVEVAIARAVRSGINKANGEIVLARCARDGIDYVKVSEHMGARVTKNQDFTNHAHWQGKVYHLDWNKPALARYKTSADAQDTNQNTNQNTDTGALQLSDNRGNTDVMESRYMQSDNPENREMSNGMRGNNRVMLTDEQQKVVLEEAAAIGIPEENIVFAPTGTSYSDEHDVIVVGGDVMPDLTSLLNRDRLSIRATLAHEWYGHRRYRWSFFAPGDWRDEFRASYMAAKDAPGLDDIERAMLFIDAYERAREAGAIVRMSDLARGYIYGDNNF